MHALRQKVVLYITIHTVKCLLNFKNSSLTIYSTNDIRIV